MIDKSNLRRTLQSNEWASNPFKVLSDIARVSSVDESTGREFVIRALDSRSHLRESYKNILQELAVNVGLHPYVEELNRLSLRSSIIHASHRAEGVMDDFILHSSQAKVLRYLAEGSSVVLSAPTSFGKSLLIDILISSRDLHNVILIVPTLALVEETRRRMARFSERYSIITSSNQVYGDKNIFVLTQERFLSLEENIPPIDFFAIDEFYKLSIEPAHKLNFAGSGPKKSELKSVIVVELMRTDSSNNMAETDAGNRSTIGRILGTPIPGHRFLGDNRF